MDINIDNHLVYLDIDHFYMGYCNTDLLTHRIGRCDKVDIDIEIRFQCLYIDHFCKGCYSIDL